MGLRLPPSGFTDKTAARAGVRYASWLRRAGALVIDLLILEMIKFLVSTMLLTVAVTLPVGTLGIFVFVVILASISVVYATLCLAKLHGQTPGMRVLGIRCVPFNHRGSVTMAQALTRSVTAAVITGAPWLWYPHLAVLFVVMIVAYLWPLVDNRRQTLWDFVAATVVMDDRGW